MANGLLNIGSWAISTPEIPGFAPPPRDEFAFLDILGIGTGAPTVEGVSRKRRFSTGSAAQRMRLFPCNALSAS
jgi:hypothetical protein